MKMIWCGLNIKENSDVFVKQFHGNFHSKPPSCRKIKYIFRVVKCCINASWGLEGLIRCISHLLQEGYDFVRAGWSVTLSDCLSYYLKNKERIYMKFLPEGMFRITIQLQDPDMIQIAWIGGKEHLRYLYGRLLYDVIVSHNCCLLSLLDIHTLMNEWNRLNLWRHKKIGIYIFSPLWVHYNIVFHPVSY